MRKPLLLPVALIVLFAGLWGLREVQRPAPPQFAPSLIDGVVTTAPADASRPSTASRDPLPAFLPAEARHTIALIQRGGPYPYRQDGGVFGNREKRLPHRPRGYYREFTVDTPGLKHRGARRIVTGGDPPEAWYYTDDHYDSFRSFEVPATGSAP